MDKTIGKIIERLKKYPSSDFVLTDNSIELKPSENNGFTVSLRVNGDNHYTVAFDYWHEEFTNEDEALNYFAFGLTRDCRLKLTKRGNRPYKWTVEYRDSDTWKKDSITARLNFAFWKKKTIEYLQNDLIK